MSLHCIRGCASKGKHLADAHPANVDCWGCEPRVAQDGQLCWPCYSGAERFLRKAPALVAHIQQHIQLAGSGLNESGVSGGNPARPPLRIEALDDADHLHAMLSSWALLHMEEHPAGLSGPTRVGSRLSVAGVAGIKPGAGAEPTEKVCEWLTRHLPWASEQEWAGEYVRELSSTIGTLMARWPEAERARAIPEVRCEVCGRRSMVYHPPGFEGGKISIQCDHGECSGVVREDRWAWFARLLVDEKREVDQQRMRERRALAREIAKAAAQREVAEALSA